MLAQRVAALAQCFHGAFHGRLAEPSAGGDTLPQPHDAGEAVKDAKAVIVRTRDQQAAIVGAKIKRRINGAAMLAVRMGRWWRPLFRRGTWGVNCPCPSPGQAFAIPGRKCRIVRRR
jgi:hypothetical protein